MPFLDVSDNDRNVIRGWCDFLYNLNSNNGRWGGDYLIYTQHNSKTELCFRTTKFWNFPIFAVKSDI